MPCFEYRFEANGRLKPENVLDVKCNSDSINNKIKTCLFDKGFIKNLKRVQNPYFKNIGKK